MTATALATLIVLVSAYVPERADAAPTPSPKNPTTNAAVPLTAEQALAKAKTSKRPVAVTGSTTPTDTLVANPTGTFTLTRTVVPTRKRVGGQWRSLDATLRRNGDGSISPAMTTSELRLSGGGSGPAVTLTDAGRSLALSLPFPLPSPSLSGATATYAQVLPGVDLKLTADRQGGVQQVLVVHDAVAAANPALSTLTLATKTTGVTVGADAAGNLAASDARGRPVFAASAPIMWDSTTAPTSFAAAASRESSAAGPGSHARTAPIRTAVTSSAISLVPDRDVLSDAGTRFPVFIDPGWVPVGAGKNGWATITNNFPGTNYWNKTPDPAGQMQVGNSGEIWSRTLVNFPIPVGTLSGATINSATFYLVNNHSWSCSARRVNITAPSATLTSGNANWNAWKNSMGGVVAFDSFAHGYSGCAAAGVGFSVRDTIAADVSSGRSTRTFGLVADNESDNFSWKEFDPSTASLTIVYNHAPNPPAGLTTSPATACGGSPVSTVGDGNVSLYAPVSDPDGSNLGVTYQLWKTSDASQTPIASSDPNSLVYPSGSTAVLVVPVATLRTAAAGAVTQFSWRVKTTDTTFESPWSATCTFAYDPTRTGAPTVTKPASATIGQPATFTIAKPATGPVPTGYLYQLNAGPPASVTATSGNGSVTVKPSRSTNVLTVTSLSAGNNIGDTATVIFNAGAAATAADQDTTGDNQADLHVVGGVNGLPNGIWQARGNGSGVNTAAVNIGANGNGVVGDNLPSNFAGAQAVTGRFTGGGLQDFLVYYPGGANPGSGMIVNGAGDGSVLQAQLSGNEHTISAGSFADINNLNPLQLANAGNSSGQGLAYPDLIGINGDPANGYYLTYYASQNGINNYQFPAQLSTATPTGGTDWNSWTITTAQTATGTSMFLWNKTTGGLYLWKNLTFDLNTSALTYTQHQLATNWNTNTTLTLQAADINTDGTADLWTITTPATARAWLVTNLTTGTGTITGTNAQTLVTSERAWPLTTLAAGTVADTTTGSTLTASGAVVSHTGDTFDPDIMLNTAADGSVLANPNGTLVGANPVVDTTQSFSVAVWVKPTAAGGVIVSEDGAHTARFYISDNASDNTWRFGMATADVAGASYDEISMPAGNQLGIWTRLTATYDAQTEAMNLYVNNIPSNTRNHSRAVTWPTSGGLAIGSAKLNNARGSYFAGQVSNVQTWNSRLTAAMMGAPGGGINWSRIFLVDGGSGFTDIAVGDLNNDGRNDLIGLAANGNVYDIPNNGVNGIVWGTTTLVDAGSGFVKIAVGDMNNDGKNDLVGLASNGNVYDIPNNGVNGINWGATTLIDGLSGFTDIAVGDLNNDGKSDLVGIGANGNVYDIPNNAVNGIGWGATSLVDAGSGFTTIAVGDMNNDGRQDLVGLSPNRSVFDIPNNGVNGISWGATTLIDGLSPYHDIAAADLNNDLKCDLVGIMDNGDVEDIPNNA